MNERVYTLKDMIIEGYSKTELARLMINGELFNEQIPSSTAYKWISDAKDLIKQDNDESDILYSRFLAVYKGCMDKKDYNNAIKALKELKEFNNTDQSDITIKFIKD